MKNKKKFLLMKARAEFCLIFRSFLGQCSFNKKCFCDLLTFIFWRPDYPNTFALINELQFCPKMEIIWISVEAYFMKFLKSNQVNLISAGFIHLKPQCVGGAHVGLLKRSCKVPKATMALLVVLLLRTVECPRLWQITKVSQHNQDIYINE